MNIGNCIWRKKKSEKFIYKKINFIAFNQGWALSVIHVIYNIIYT